MKNEALRRPLITEFMGAGFTLKKAHKMYLNNIELWNYIQALDKYCDELESKLCEGNSDSDTSDSLHFADVSFSEEQAEVCDRGLTWNNCEIWTKGTKCDNTCKHFKQTKI